MRWQLMAEYRYNKACARPGDGQQTCMGVPGSRLDLAQLTAGRPTRSQEMTFPGDRLRGNQELRYQRTAGRRLQLINIPRNCNNREGERQPETQTDGPGNWGIAGIGLRVVGAAVLTWWAGGSGGAASDAALDLGAASAAM